MWLLIVLFEFRDYNLWAQTLHCFLAAKQVLDALLQHTQLMNVYLSSFRIQGILQSF